MNRKCATKRGENEDVRDAVVSPSRLNRSEGDNLTRKKGGKALVSKDRLRLERNFNQFAAVSELKGVVERS